MFPVFVLLTSPTILRVNFHTGGLLGEYEVEGCNGTSPTLLLERDQTYTMIQARLSNQILHQHSSLGEGQTYTILLA